MRVRSFQPLRAVLVAALLAAAGAPAEAVMYRWIDQNGSLTYSDKPPMDPSRVTALTVIDRPSAPSVHERRTLEIIEAERRRNAEGLAGGEPTQESGVAVGREHDPSGRWIWGRESDPAAAPGNGENLGASRLPARSPRAEAAQDPCLRSADPRCFEKNREAYVPYLGYAPSAARAMRSSDPVLPIGGTPGASAGGTVGPAYTAVTPPRRYEPWRVRDSLKNAKDLQ